MRLHFHYVRQSEMDVLQIIIMNRVVPLPPLPRPYTAIICANRERQFQFAYDRFIHCTHNVRLPRRNRITAIFIDFDFQTNGAVCVAGSHTLVARFEMPSIVHTAHMDYHIIHINLCAVSVVSRAIGRQHKFELNDKYHSLRGNYLL